MLPRHLILCHEREVVDQMLVPCLDKFGWEAAEANGDDVHVEEGDSSPGLEGWVEAERC